MELVFFFKPPFQDKRLDSVKVIILFRHIFFFFFLNQATFSCRTAGHEKCELHPQSSLFYDSLCVLPTYAGVIPPNVGWICSSRIAHVTSCKTDCLGRARRAPSCGRNWVKLIKTAEPQPSSKAKIPFLRHILISDSDEKCCSFPLLWKKTFQWWIKRISMVMNIWSGSDGPSRGLSFCHSFPTVDCLKQKWQLWHPDHPVLHPAPPRY